MQKLIEKDSYGGRDYLRGVTESVTWIPTRWDGGPKESGEYLTSDGQGNVIELYYARTNEDCRQLFDSMVHSTAGEIFISYADNDNELSAQELIDTVYLGKWLWYTITYLDAYELYDTYYTIYVGDHYPKYYLKSELHGPIDDDLDSYEEILVDDDLNVITNSEELES